MAAADSLCCSLWIRAPKRRRKERPADSTHHSPPKEAPPDHGSRRVPGRVAPDGPQQPLVLPPQQQPCTHLRLRTSNRHGDEEPVAAAPASIPAALRGGKPPSRGFYSLLSQLAHYLILFSPFLLLLLFFSLSICPSLHLCLLICFPLSSGSNPSRSVC